MSDDFMEPERLETMTVVAKRYPPVDEEDTPPAPPPPPSTTPLSGQTLHVGLGSHTYLAACSEPDFCQVGDRVVGFDSTATLGNPVRYSPDVVAAGSELYREGDLFQGVQGDAGQHVVSGTSLGSGHVLITGGQSNVKANGLPIARHGSPCRINCDASGTGGARGYLVTAEQRVESRAEAAGGGRGEYTPGEEGERVVRDWWEDATAAGQNMWEALPFTSDAATTTAAREQIVRGAQTGYEGLSTLSGPNLFEVADGVAGWATGDEARTARYNDAWQETGEAWDGAKDTLVNAWQEAEERNGFFGALEMATVTVALELWGTKGAGGARAAGELGSVARRTPETPPRTPDQGLNVEQPSTRRKRDDDSENSNNRTTATDVQLDSQGRFRDKNGILRTNAGPNAPEFARWKENGGSVKYNEATDTIIYGKPGMETSSMGNIDVEVSYKPGPPDGHRYPDFSNYSKENVTIPEMRGLPESKINPPEGGDFSKAWNEVSKQKGDNYVNETHGISRRSRGSREGQWPDKPSRGYTWHHHGDESTMQLVDKDIHAIFTHKGGASASR
ncbi:HNH endonuclease [Vreelandella sp. EE27]